MSLILARRVHAMLHKSDIFTNSIKVMEYILYIWLDFNTSNLSHQRDPDRLLWFLLFILELKIPY